MRRFFHGWRRKWGCVLLLVALLFTGIWFRSRAVVDLVTIRSTRTLDRISTTSRGFKWERMRAIRAPDFPPSARSNWISHPVTSFRSNSFDTLRGIYSVYGTKSNWKLCGFQSEIGHFGSATFVYYGSWVIPFWPLTTVPTLLATCLLLGRARKQSPPVVNEVAHA
ncbi:MAG: hypothetical protein JSS49_18135 [Planctomycetes bacterium]|nr:hypothetical protein [Planctomycetota bacterium]